MFLRTFRNLFLRLTDQHEFLHLAVKTLNPLIIFRLFVITSTDQQCRTVHRADSLDCRIRVCSLGIIVKLHAAFFCHILNSMLDCLETFQHFHNFIHRYAKAYRHSDCRHDILIIVFS